MSEKAISNIDFTKSEQLTLSIRIDADGFSFDIYQHFSKQTAASFYREIEPTLTFVSNLEQVFSGQEFLCRPYKQVNIVIADERFATIPLYLFNKKQIESVYAYNHLKKDNEIVLYDILEENDMAVIFGTDKNLYQFLNGQYPQAKFSSHVSSLIEYCSVLGGREGFSKRMYVCLHDKSIDICCFEFKRLLFINSFRCKTMEDRIYYILHIWKQLDFNQETNKLYMTNIKSDKDLMMQELKRYILNVLPFDMQVLPLREG